MPQFPTSSITTPTAIFYGKKDTLPDVEFILDNTLHPVMCMEVEGGSFTPSQTVKVKLIFLKNMNICISYGQRDSTRSYTPPFWGSSRNSMKSGVTPKPNLMTPWRHLKACLGSRKRQSKPVASHRARPTLLFVVLSYRTSRTRLEIIS